MAEYIEREAVLRAYIDLCTAKSKLAKTRKGAAFFQSDLLPETELTDKEWVRLINATPAADVAPVVRCKDCKHYHAAQGWCDKHSHFIDSDGRFCHPWESDEWKMFEPDDFCSYGERKDGEG